MKSSYHQSLGNEVANNRQLDESQLNYCQQVATEAMLCSFMDYSEDVASYDNEENHSYVLGYN